MRLNAEFAGHFLKTFSNNVIQSFSYQFAEIGEVVSGYFFPEIVGFINLLGSLPSMF